MEGLGLHILMEFHGCSFKILNDLPALEVMMNDAAEVSNATIIKSVFHQFSPQGVTGIIVVAESHLAIHTWPENNYAGADFFTCGTRVDPLIAYEYIKQQIECKYSNYIKLDRGKIEEIEKAAGHSSI